MPVTLAHPAAVLPLRGPRAAAVGAGDRVDGAGPAGAGADLGVLLVQPRRGRHRHPRPRAERALLAFWDAWGRDALVDTAPGAVRDRLPAHHRIGRRGWLLAPLAAVVGSTTHTVWDAFTHQGRWGERHVAWLRDTHGALPGQQWAQFASGVLGLLVVGWAIVHHVWRSPRSAPRPRRLPVATLPAGVAVATAISVTGGLLHRDGGWHDAAFHAAVAGILALAALVGLLGVAWRCAPEVRSRVGA